MPKIPTTAQMKNKAKNKGKKNKNKKKFPAPWKISPWQTIPIQTQNPVQIQNIPVPSQNILVQSQNIPMQSQNIPLQSQNIPLQSQNIPMQSQNIPLQSQNIPMQSQNIPLQSQNIPVQSQNIPLQSQNIPVQSQNIPVQSQNIPMQSQNIPVQTQNMPMQNVQPDNNIPVVRQILPVPTVPSKPKLPNSVILNASVMMQGIKNMAKFINFQQKFHRGKNKFPKNVRGRRAPNITQYSQFLPTPGSSNLYTSFETNTSGTTQGIKSQTETSQGVQKFTQNQKPGVSLINSQEQKLSQKESQSVNQSISKNTNNKQGPANFRTLVEINAKSADVAKLNVDSFKQSDGVNKVKVFKESQQSFRTKIQEQFAKKLESMNKSENTQNSGKIDSKHTVNNPNQTISAEAKKTAKHEIIIDLSSDINKDLRENLRLNMNEQLNTVYNEEDIKLKIPSGVPITFLYNQNSLGAIEPRKDFANKPTSKWDVKTRIQTPTPQVVEQSSESQTFVQSVYANMGLSQSYSPTEMYEEFNNEEEADCEVLDPPEIVESGQKRLSAFQRLGPLAQPKKPKLTINLSLSKDQDVREVVETQKEVPVYDNEEFINSKDDIVMKFLPLWPYKKHIGVKKSVTARFSKTVMMMEQEQMEEVYEKDNIFIMILVKGYPPAWTKEEVLDLMLENLKGKSFIPCFIEFNSKECKFLVIRSRSALLYIHWLGFIMRKDDVEIKISITRTVVTLKKMDFLPRLMLKKRLSMYYDGERALDLSEFLLKNDISHFLYFPLNRTCNQAELVLLPSDISWEYLTELNLSRNRIKSIEGFCFESTMPKLKSLDLSHNYIDSIKVFLQCRKLPLRRLVLEGNPLCTDYIDPERYIKVMRTIFPTLRELDNIPIVLKGDMPKFKQNYCPDDAKIVVEKFLEVYFPLLELPQDERKCIQSMYSEQAMMTITYRNKIRHDHSFKNARNLLIKSRVLLQGNTEYVHGASNIVKLLNKWPDMQHYPSTFRVDVIHHSESSTILTINGLLKLTADTLAEDETLLAFTRTVHLYTKHGSRYRIYNEMMYWDQPTEESSKRAFQILAVPKKNEISLKFESTPDDKIKDELVRIFMKLTELEKLPSERCLEAKDWHIKHALEYFVKLLKTDNIHILMK